MSDEQPVGLRSVLREWMATLTTPMDCDPLTDRCMEVIAPFVSNPKCPGFEPIAKKREAFKVLAERCPKCGDRLIQNNTGFECGAFRCDYHAGGEKYVR